MGKVYVIGTCDTKHDELVYAKRMAERAGAKALLADVSTRPHKFTADITAETIAGFHPMGQEPVFQSEIGRAHV